MNDRPNAAPLSGLPARVRVVEVGPRDGLQNEPVRIATADKVAYVDLLSEAGFAAIEATSFVSPRAVPQLADAAEVLDGIRQQPGTQYIVLTPNLKGYERAVAAGARAIAVFTAATETFARRNINASIAESLANFRPIVEAARREGIWVRGYVSTAFGCPFEGDVAPAAVLDVSQRLLDLGVDELSVGDTIGVATPRGVEEVVDPLLRHVPADRLAVHFHDTRGTALANVLLSLQLGVGVVDASAGGLGGCPFAPGAAGNLATEDLLYMLHGLGIETGVDLEQVVAASRFIAGKLGHAPASKYLQAAGCPIPAQP